MACVLGLTAMTRGAAAQPMGPELLLADTTDLRRVAAGRDHVLALRLDSAEATFAQLARRPGGLAASLHYRSLVSLLRGFLTDDALHVTRFGQRADSLRRYLRSQPATRWRHVLEGDSELLRAIAQGRAERLARAGLSAKSAYDAYERAQAGGVAMPDADKGRGLIELLVGSAPRTYRFVLRLLGYGGSVEGGRRRLERAATSGRHAREEAALMLSLLDLVVRGGA